MMKKIKKNLEQANSDLEKDDVNKGDDKEKSPPKEKTIEEKLKDTDKSTVDKEKVENKKVSLEEKLKETESKLLRSLAEIENQRRRFEREIKDAFEFGSLTLQKKV